MTHNPQNSRKTHRQHSLEFNNTTKSHFGSTPSHPNTQPQQPDTPKAHTTLQTNAQHQIQLPMHNNSQQPQRNTQSTNNNTINNRYTSLQKQFDDKTLHALHAQHLAPHTQHNAILLHKHTTAQPMHMPARTTCVHSKSAAQPLCHQTLVPASPCTSCDHIKKSKQAIKQPAKQKKQTRSSRE